MMIEHSFVTTKPWPMVVSSAVDLYGRIGLHLVGTCLRCGGERVMPSLDELDSECPACSGPRTVLFSRGIVKPRSNVETTRQPLWLCLEYDRGRVDLAAALVCSRTPESEQRAMLSFLPALLETVLLQDDASDKMMARWTGIRKKARHDLLLRRKGGVRAFLLICAILAAMAVVGLIVVRLYLLQL